jgi:hypothetical protein
LRSLYSSANNHDWWTFYHLYVHIFNSYLLLLLVQN